MISINCIENNRRQRSISLFRAAPLLGLQQLMRTRTSKKFFLSRLTPDMENKLLFLMTKVRFGQQKRYQDWFQKQVRHCIDRTLQSCLIPVRTMSWYNLGLSICRLPRVSRFAAT